MNGWLGVDWKQWRALTWASIKIDKFTSMATGGAGAHSGKKRWHPMVGAFIFYCMMGMYFAMIALFLADPFLSASIVLLLIMALIVSMILMEFHSVVISPDDFEVLGHRPIDSRTYFFARMANVFIYTLLSATAIGLFPMIAFFFQVRGGFAFQPLVGLAFIPALYLAAIASTLCAILVYATLARVLHPRRIKRVMGYVQIVLSFTFFGGYVLLAQVMRVDINTWLGSERSWWMLLAPPAWFASYVDLAQGRWDLFTLLLAACSFGALGVMLAYAVRVISIDYAERLALMSQVSEGKEAEKAAREAERKPRWFRSGERRAVALLVRNQFKHDNKFRMAVFSVVPLMVIYVAMAVVSGDIRDPFTIEQIAQERQERRAEIERAIQAEPENQELYKALAGATRRDAGMDQSFLFLIVLFMFPAILRMNMTRSDSYLASWVYFSTPADKGRLALAMKEFIALFFLAPLLVAIFGAFWYFFGDGLHAALHTLVLGLFAHLFAQLSFVISAELPFSTPLRKGERFNALLMMMIILPMIIAMAGLPLLTTFVYISPVRIAALIAALVALNVLFEWAARWRTRRVTARLQFVN